jgi:5-methyltetrahydrofolate--homocysteine methyltransferase
MGDYDVLVETIQKGDIAGTQNIVKTLLDGGGSPQEIIENGIIKALNIVGKKFSLGEAFIPEMLIAARASHKGLDTLKPFLLKGNFEKRGKVVIGTVRGDLHDIGKNIVRMMLEASGFDVRDLGVDVSPEKFVHEVDTFGSQILCLSCLLTTTMENMRVTIEQLEKSDLRGRVKVLIGGPPTSTEFARKIGADYYGEDAYKGVEIARRIMPK